MKRRLVREKALQALYAYELSGEPIDLILDTIVGSLKKEAETFTFAKTLILSVIEHREEIDTMIRSQVEHWEFNRLAVIDKIILRIAICELLYCEDIPPKVSINEAIEIARRFSTEKSDKFVNGVLDSVLDRMKQNGRLQKRGRGLLDIPTKKSSAS